MLLTLGAGWFIYAVAEDLEAGKEVKGGANPKGQLMLLLVTLVARALGPDGVIVASAHDLRHLPGLVDETSEPATAAQRRGSSAVLMEGNPPMIAKPWTLAVAALLLAIGCFRLSETLADPDLWGHVRFGQDTLQAGTIIHQDPYSYLTQGGSWINHEWLAEVLFALAFDTAGTPGLIALKVLAGLAILGLCYGHLVRQPLDPLRAAMLSLPLILLLLPGLGCVRPQLFTCLLFTLTLLIIEAADRGETRRLWWLPPLFTLWANLHGGYLAGLAVLATWAAVFLLQQVWQARSPAALLTGTSRTIVVSSILSFLATLLNPYGIDLLLFLLRTATQPRPDINEWHALRLTSLEGLVFLLLLGMALVGLLGARQSRRPALLAVLAGMALAPWLSIRHLPLASVSVLIIAGGPIAKVWNRWLPETDQAASRRGLVVALCRRPRC